MSDTAHAPAPTPRSGHDAHGAHGHHAHSDKDYIKIWASLLGLLAVSLIGPIIGEKLGIFAITLVTAFGIAGVKAYLVVTKFMHIGVEKKYVSYLLVGMLGLMGLMVGGVGPDVLRHKGTRWVNRAAQDEVARGLKAGVSHGAHQEGGHEPAPPAAPH
jgi:caa(3)-type oxidase subunit IV